MYVYMHTLKSKYNTEVLTGVDLVDYYLYVISQGR